MLGLYLGAWTQREEKEGGRQQSCSHSLLCEQDSCAGAAHPAPASPLAVPGAPLPRFTDLQNLGM